MASFLQTRSDGGKWFVRIDDIDPPRAQAGAVDSILNTLEGLGFPLDNSVKYQSQSTDAYLSALVQLNKAGTTYACRCSRKIIAASGSSIYPGTCRELELPTEDHALRIRLVDKSVSFNDRIQGPVSQLTRQEIGDFVIKRRDGLFSYQLATVVDDQQHGVTQVVRGADLLYDTLKQIALIELLGFNKPEFMHIPFATDSQGNKLSKQTGATPLDLSQKGPAGNSAATAYLLRAWHFLGQQHPDSSTTPAEFWAFAEQAWDPERIPMIRSKPCNTGPDH